MKRAGRFRRSARLAIALVPEHLVEVRKMLAVMVEVHLESSTVISPNVRWLPSERSVPLTAFTSPNSLHAASSLLSL
jgi:hypothetical protein